MILRQLDILNYKNIAEAHLEFAPGVNCLIGNNGMGKTNVLDAIYFLSMTKSHTSPTNGDVIRHEQEMMLLQGLYSRRGQDEQISIGLQRGKRKVVKRGGKEYQRMSQHVGLLPVVVVSPLDADLIRGAGEERRHFLDRIIAQTDRDYLDALIRHTRAIEQRNSLLRNGTTDRILFESVEAMICSAARLIHDRRSAFAEQFTPIFGQYYADIAGEQERVGLTYESPLNDATPEQVLDSNRQRDAIMGYTTRGVHRDDICLTLNGHPMRRVASQGQSKTYTVALRLAQFDFLRQNNATTPALLLDDIFDRLDARRVERIIAIVAGERFGQIFVTDTNRDHLDRIINHTAGEHRIFEVADGQCTPIGT